MLYSDEVTQQGGEAIVPILTGTVTLTPTQALAKTIVLTGSLTGAVTVVFPPNVAQRWIIDATAVTLNTHAITADANSQAWGTTIGVSDLYEVIYGGVGRLYGVALTPDRGPARRALENGRAPLRRRASPCKSKPSGRRATRPQSGARWSRRTSGCSAARRPPERAGCCRWRSSALETAHWQAMWNWNAGNVTSSRPDAEDWLRIPTSGLTLDHGGEAGTLRFRAYGLARRGHRRDGRMARAQRRDRAGRRRRRRGVRRGPEGGPVRGERSGRLCGLREEPHAAARRARARRADALRRHRAETLGASEKTRAACAARRRSSSPRPPRHSSSRPSPTEAHMIHVFPVQGQSSFANDFGAGTHDGIDISAAEGLHRRGRRRGSPVRGGPARRTRVLSPR